MFRHPPVRATPADGCLPARGYRGRFLPGRAPKHGRLVRMNRDHVLCCTPPGRQTCTVRPLRSSDVEEIVAVQASSFHRPMLPVFQSFSKQVFEAEVRSSMKVKVQELGDRFAMLVAELDPYPGPVAIVELTKLDPRDPVMSVRPLTETYGDVDVGWIASMAVRPDLRRQGCAGALLTGAENMAKGWGCKAMALVAYQSNAPALSLYDKAGFERIGQFDAGLLGLLGRESEVLMGKKLLP